MSIVEEVQLQNFPKNFKQNEPSLHSTLTSSIKTLNRSRSTKIFLEWRYGMLLDLKNSSDVSDDEMGDLPKAITGNHWIVNLIERRLEDNTITYSVKAK